MRRFRNYIFLFVLLLIPLMALNRVWQNIDYAFYKSFYLNIPGNEMKLPEDIKLIELPYDSNNNDQDRRTNYRKRLSDLLFTIEALSDQKNKPNSVILDIWFSEDKTELESIRKAINQLQEKEIKVYAVFDMLNYDEEPSFEERYKKMSAELYKQFDGGLLHDMYSPDHGIFSYRSLLFFEKENGDDTIIVSLPFKVGRDNMRKSDIGPTDFTKNQNFILPIGDPEELKAKTIQFVHEANQTVGGEFVVPMDEQFNIKDKYLIIASPLADYKKNVNQYGPHLLAWALNDQLSPKPIANQPLNSILFIIAMVIFFSLFVTLMFAVIFKYIKSLQTKPRVIAILSLLSGVFLQMVFGYLMLQLNYVIPIGLSLVSMLLVAFLGMHYYNKFVVTRVAEGSGKHDIFISYSHGDKDWVKQNLYLPLCEFKKPDGSSLDIFFDEKNIENGEVFTAKYMWGIVDSKLFIPVMSKDYSKKSHCKNEMELAYTRKVENKIKIFTIAFEFGFVPEIYHHTLVTDISVQKDFLESLKKQLV